MPGEFAVKDGYGVIFDMDGVLVDSYRPHFESWRLTAREYGLVLEEQQFSRLFGRTSREIIAEVWPREFSDDWVKAFDQRKEFLYRDLIRANVSP